MMEKSTISKSSIGDEVKDPIDHELQELVKTLPRVKHLDGLHLYLYNNSFWCPSVVFKSMVSFQKHFQAKDTDIILATALKSGTTWLKALTFNVINRAKYSPNVQHPLLISNPHELVPNFEFDLYMKDENSNLDDLSCPRILSTHLPFSGLPNSILNSNCRIIYICRNPLDQFISYWHFMLEIFKNRQTDQDNMETPPNIDEAFDLFCQGTHAFGPFWHHASGCWRASIESPHKVLFLKYEDLKYDINTQVKNIAEFLGFGFTMEEEKRGLIEQISNMCSFENLKNLQVNKEGRRSPVVMNRSFFRNGQVGDWVNFLSTSQAQHLENITKEKLAGSDLTFKSFCNSSF